MIIMMISSIILMFIAIILIMMNILFSKKSFSDREKLSPYECGFDPITNLHAPFSMHFFIISLIFLIFDIEIIFLIPLIFTFPMYNTLMLISSIFFLLILLLGLYIEYINQALDWKI